MNDRGRSHQTATRVSLETSEPMSGPAFAGFRETQLAIVSSWTAAVSLYAAGLRLQDERLLVLAEKQRHLAEEYEQIARRYVPGNRVTPR